MKKMREKSRAAASRTEARHLIRVLWSEVEQEKELKILDQVAADRAVPRSFKELSDTYLAERVIPPVYTGGRKIAGMREHRQISHEVKVLTDHFGPRIITKIIYTDIEQYKRLRLSTKTIFSQERKISGFNHELRRLRAMFNFAIQKQWLFINPFKQGPSLISAADEVPRDLPRGDKEEEKLLAQCIGRREYLRTIIIFAIDTAARLGELLKVRRRDIDLDND
jgi:integrase